MKPSASIGIVLPFVFFVLICDRSAAHSIKNSERRIDLWSGESFIVASKVVRVHSSKKNQERYVLTAKGSDVRVVIERGLIPSQYRGADNQKIAGQAEQRLRHRGYTIERSSVVGKTVNIIFSGTRAVDVETPLGPMQVEIPFQGRLKWVRQTNHRTYQSLIVVPEPEKNKPAAGKLLRAAGSLSVPPMKRSPWDRVRDSTSSLPLLADRVGSWMPGWKVW